MLRYKVKVRKGKWADSPQNPERRDRRKNPIREEREPKRERRVKDLSGVLRRDMSEEVGESELSKEHRFALLQKYGIVAAKIDRKVVRPSWKNEKQFNQELNDWYRATKGLVPAVQVAKKFTPTRKPVFTKASDPSLKRKFRTELRKNERPIFPHKG